MKKTLLASLFCLAALTACQKNLTEVAPLEEGEAMATFTVSMAPQTKATIDNDGNAAKVNRCILEVYSNDMVYRHVETKVDPETLTATFRLPLVISQKYDFLFWADCATLDASLQTFTDLYYDTQSLKAVKIIDETTGNLDEKDAFFCYDHNVTFTGAATKDYVLTRPFAQVNIITDDLLEIKNSVNSDLAQELWPDKIEVEYTTTFPTQFNVYDGTCSESQTIARKAEAVYGCSTAATQNTLNMDYIFVNTLETDKVNSTGYTVEPDPETKESFAITEAIITLKNGSTITILENEENIPIKRNYRTNIIGSFLTDPMDYTVTIKPIWGDPDYEHTVPAPAEAQGCTITIDPETGEPVATYIPGSPIVVIPEGVTKFDLNPESENYQMSVESITIPSTITIADEGMVNYTPKLTSITYNVEGVDFTFVKTFLLFAGANVISAGGNLELNLIGIPNSLKFMKYDDVYANKHLIDDSSLEFFSQTSPNGKIQINLPAGWIAANLPYKFKGDNTGVVVFENGTQVYPEI